MSSSLPYLNFCSTPIPKSDILVVGAGPTGLGALEALKSISRGNFRLAEASSHPGGLARTLRDPQGFQWEIGGHVTFSHYPRFDHIFETYIGNDYSLIERESWVRFKDSWIPYPFQQNLRYLPEPERERCLSQLEEAQRLAHPKRVVSQAASFAELIQGVFGRGIAEVFMTPYNTKVWSTKPDQMATKWLGERVALVDAKRARENATLQRDEFGWGPNNTFKFPLDGTGAIYDRMAAVHADSIHTETRLTRVNPDKRVACFEGPEQQYEVPYEHLISTLPLDKLVTQIIEGVPERIMHAAAGLHRASGTMVGIGVRKPCPATRSWMYFPGSEAPFYRVTYLSNYSPRMAPAGCYSMLCEISRPAGSEPPADAVEQTIRGLEATGMLGTSETGSRDDIVSTWVHHIDHSYPVPTLDRDDRLAVILPWLEQRGILSRGRFGLWKYEVANTDHSVMQGIEAVERIVNGTPETTIGIQYDTEQATHYRPAVAGSGEKRSSPTHPNHTPPPP